MAFYSRFFVPSIGFIYGLLYLLAHKNAIIFINQYITSKDLDRPPYLDIPIEGFFMILGMPFILLLVRELIHTFIRKKVTNEAFITKFKQTDIFLYLIFLVSIFFPLGLKPSIAITLLCFVILLILYIALAWFISNRNDRHSYTSSLEYIAFLFLISGFSALIYQVVWQRSLFTVFGTNTESVTVVVSVFMFGLGIGALLGGVLQRIFPDRLLTIFLLFEILIGVFGLFSLELIHWAGTVFRTSSLSVLTLCVYAILAFPTLLMGATLPTLVAILQPHFRNLGKTVGLLYALNTLGSAIAAFLTVEMLFVLFDQQETIYIAVGCNFLTAYLIFEVSKNLNRPIVPTQPSTISSRSAGREFPQIPFPMALLLTAAIGYISLSQEIIWHRLLSYITGSKPQIFGYLLAAFLVGIAAGSLKAKKISESDNPHTFLFITLAITTLIFYLTFPLVSFLSALLGSGIGTLSALIGIAVVSFYLGGVFPLLAHMGISPDDKNASLKLSVIYFSNIIGATFGPLVTGFFLFDRYGLEMNVIIVTGLGMALFVLVFATKPEHSWIRVRHIVGVVTVMVLFYLSHPLLYKNFFERTFYFNFDSLPFKYREENQSGILTVATGHEASSDTMYGGGVYDGKFNTDLVINSNGIDRAYMIATLHRNPRRFLEIGLSTGSWASVVGRYAPLEELISIEINKGYAELIRNYPAISTILNHPKIHIQIDDGRRWLQNHPNEKFDFILMNATLHWRSNSTHLLSKEFLEICKAHLNPGGVVYYNATGSRDVAYTAAHVFKHVTQVGSFIAVSDSPFDMTQDEKRNNLLHFYPPQESKQKRDYLRKLEELAIRPLKDIAGELLMDKNLQLITDNNMAIEYKVATDHARY